MSQARQFNTLIANDKLEAIKQFLSMGTAGRATYLNTQSIDAEKAVWKAVGALSVDERIKLSGSIYESSLLRLEEEMRTADPCATSVRFRHFFASTVPNLPEPLAVDLLGMKDWGSARVQLKKQATAEGVSLEELEAKLFDINVKNCAVSLDGPEDGRGLNGVKCGSVYITFSTGGKSSFSMDIMRIDYARKEMRRVFAIDASRYAALTDIIQAASPLDPSSFNSSFTLVKNMQTDQALTVCRSEYPEKAKELRKALIDFIRNAGAHPFAYVMGAIDEFNEAFDELLEKPIFASQSAGTKRCWVIEDMLESKEKDLFKLFYNSHTGKLVDFIPRNVKELAAKLIICFTVKQGLTDDEIEIILSQFLNTAAGKEFLGQNWPEMMSNPTAEIVGYSEGLGYSLSSRITREALGECVKKAERRELSKGNSFPIEVKNVVDEIEESKDIKPAVKSKDLHAPSLQYEVYLTPRIAEVLYRKIGKKDGKYGSQLAEKSNRNFPDLINEALAILKEEKVLGSEARFLCFNWAYHKEVKEVQEGDRFSEMKRQLPSPQDGSSGLQEELGYIQNDNGHVVLMSEEDIKRFKVFVGEEADDFEVGPLGSAERRLRQLGTWVREISDLNETMQPGDDKGNEEIKAQMKLKAKKIERALPYNPPRQVKGREKTKGREAKKTHHAQLEEQTIASIQAALNELKREVKDITDQNERGLLEDLTETLEVTLKSTYVKPDPVLFHSIAEDLEKFIDKAPVMQPSVLNHIGNIILGVLFLGTLHFYERYHTGQWTIFHDLKAKTSKTKMRLEAALTRLEGLGTKEHVRSSTRPRLSSKSALG